MRCFSLLLCAELLAAIACAPAVGPAAREPVPAEFESLGAEGSEASEADSAEPDGVSAHGSQHNASTRRDPGMPSDSGDEHAHDAHDDEIADEPDEDNSRAQPAAKRPPHPLAGVSDAELLRRLREDPASLGSMSLGLPNGGRLINARALPEDERWVRVDPSHAYGTQETVDYLAAAIGQVFTRFADTPKVFVGHLSAQAGGYLKPHKSHQSGRDVDLGYFHHGDAKWYQRATATNLDRARTWALVRALVTETDPQFILIDHSIQVWLREYADSIGEDPAWLDDLFKGTPGLRPAMIRHAKGHATHLHVRFFNPIAEQTGRRSYAGLVALGRLSPPTHYVTHRVKKGETLIHLAKRYGTTVAAIKRANRLRSNTIMARKEYKIPRKGLTLPGGTSVLPERRLPPDDRPAAPVAALDKPGG